MMPKVFKETIAGTLRFNISKRSSLFMRMFTCHNVITKRPKSLHKAFRRHLMCLQLYILCMLFSCNTNRTFFAQVFYVNPSLQEQFIGTIEPKIKIIC